jgi:hypothetical protein
LTKDIARLEEVSDVTKDQIHLVMAITSYPVQAREPSQSQSQFLMKSRIHQVLGVNKLEK